MHMAISFGNFQGMPTQQSTQPGFQIPQYQPQPFFPQPQGSVYLASSLTEMANIPIGTGISAVFCMPEGLVSVKTMQNGAPAMLTYKLVPYVQEQAQPQAKQQTLSLENVLDRLEALEQRLGLVGGQDRGKINEQLL